MPGKTAFLLLAITAGMMSVYLAGCTDTSSTSPTSTTPGATPPAAASTPAAAQSGDTKAQQVAAPAFAPP
ncbi:MAG: hypothetical protein ACHQ1F_12865, partial [Spirochaetia bacterium]